MTPVFRVIIISLLTSITGAIMGSRSLMDASICEGLVLSLTAIVGSSWVLHATRSWIAFFGLISAAVMGVSRLTWLIQGIENRNLWGEIAGSLAGIACLIVIGISKRQSFLHQPGVQLPPRIFSISIWFIAGIAQTAEWLHSGLPIQMLLPSLLLATVALITVFLETTYGMLGYVLVVAGTSISGFELPLVLVFLAGWGLAALAGYYRKPTLALLIGFAATLSTHHEYTTVYGRSVILVSIISLSCALLGIVLRTFHDQTRRSEQQISRIAHRTRQDIREDLHNITARQLTRIIIQLRALRHDSDGQLLHDLALLETDAQTALEGTRAVMDGLDIANSCSALPASWGRAKNLTLRMHWQVSTSGTQTVEESLLEALANAEKYAAPNTDVIVTGTENDGWITVNVTNVLAEPIDPSTTDLGSRRGLATLKSRVTELGGTCSAGQHNGRWITSWTVPLAA